MPIKPAHKPSALVTALLALAIFTLTACSSPEEKAKSYYEKGNEFLQKNELVKARIEFKNALQISNSMASAWYGMAEIAEREGDWQGLYKLLNKVLELEPKHLDAQLKVARLLLAADELDKALEATKKAEAISPEDSAVLALQAAMQLKLNNPQGAIEFAQKALAKKPNNVDALVVLATERINAGDNEKALVYLDQSLKESNKYFAVQLIKAQALTNLSRLDQTEDVYKKLIESFPETKEFRVILARFYLSQKRYQDAENVFRKIIEVKPDDLEAKTELVKFLLSFKGVPEAQKEFESLVANKPDDYPLQLSLVNFYLAQKKVDAALGTLQKIIKKEGDAKYGLLSKSMVASIKITQGDKKTAKQLVDEVLAIDKRHEQALLINAGLSIEERKLDEAISDLRTLLRDTPNSSQALYMLGKAHEAQGSEQLADENYLRAVQTSKMASNYVLVYAEFLLRRNQAQRAEKVLEEALPVAQDSSTILKLLAQSKLSRGDWAGAQQVADMAAKINDKGALSEQIKGAIYAGQQNYAGSISAFKRAYEASPQSLQPVISLVRSYLAAGKTKEAATFLDSILKENPKNIDAHIMQGQLYVLLGEKQKAEQALNKVIELQPSNPIGYQQLASFYIRSKRLNDAESTIDKGLSVAPKDPGLKYARAGIYEISGRTDDAIKAYQELIEAQPGADVAVNNLASLLSEYKSDKGSLQKAYDLSLRFKNSEIPQFLDTYGWASYKVGKFQDAQTALKTVVDKLPNAAIMRYHLGMTYLALNDKSNAKSELEKALELSKNSPLTQAEEVKSILKSL